MVRNVIELIQEMLAQSKENERLNKPKFKLVPRKVQEVNSINFVCHLLVFQNIILGTY